MDNEGRFVGADNLADVIRRAGTESLSGTLTVICNNSPTELHYYLGKLTGSGNPERPRRLGQILLSRGLVDRAALEEALAYQQDFSPGTPLGKVLVFRERITPQALQDAIKLQLEEELWDLLMQTDGTYRFFAKPGPLVEPPLVELDPEPLVKLVIERRAEWVRIKQKITNDSLIPAVVKMDTPSDREALSFDKKEWQILSLVNGYYDVGAISARSGLGRFESYRILNNFLSSGIISLKAPKEPVPADLSGDGTAPAAGPTSSAGSSSSRWSGILAKMRDAEDPENPAIERGRLHFESPVSFVVAAANTLLGKLMQNADFIVDPNDERLAERYWRQMLMNYPRADLVQAEMNTLDATSFDRYIRTLGVQGPMKSIYLETMEALNRFLRTLYLLCSQRLGSKLAKTLFVETMEGLRQRSSMKNSETFFFKEFAAKILE